MNEDFNEFQTSNEDSNKLSNLDFLSRMLHRDLRGYIKPYYKYLRKKFSDSVLDLFIDITDKLSDENVTPEVLNAILPDMGVTDVRKEVIVRNFTLINEDKTEALKRSTYERFREIVYREYFDMINTGSAVETLEKIQNSDFFLPPYGVTNSDNFKQVDFGAFDIDSITEDLGSPLYSHFKEINETSPIKGYIPSQVTMVAGPPASQTGDTKVLLTNGETKTLAELYETDERNIEVYCVDDNGNLRVSKAERCVLTKLTDDIVKITLKGGTVLRATPEHWYRTISGEWVEAQQLQVGMSLTPFHRVAHGRSDTCYTFQEMSGSRNTSEMSFDYYEGRERGSRFKTDYNKNSYVLKVISWMQESKLLKEPSDLTEERYRYLSELYGAETGAAKIPSFTKVISIFETAENAFLMAKGYSDYDIIGIEHLTLPNPIPVYDLLNVDKYRNFVVFLEDKDGVDQGIISHNCFIGSTMIRQPDGSIDTIHNMHEKHVANSVQTLNTETGEVYWTWKNDGSRKTGSAIEFTRIWTSTRPEQPVVCTPNHLFLVLDWKKGIHWVQAVDLKEGMILYSNPGKTYVRVTKTDQYKFYKPLTYYDIVNNENSNYFINVGEEDICVHNSGKTLLMMTEAVEAVLQGKKVLYAAIGDLKPFDFASRMCSMLLKSPMTKTALSMKQSYEAVIRLYPQFKDNLAVQFISPDKYTANQWIKLNEQLGNIEKFDVFFIDYDTNFASEKDSMYAKGDEIYTMAYTLSQIPGKYVFIGSQPKIGTWKDGELGLESASESSRKQQIIDVMITISHDRNVRNPKNHLGTINIPKNRRGGNTKFKYILDPTGVMESITDEAYAMFKDDDNAISVVQTENKDLSTKYVDLSKSREHEEQFHEAQQKALEEKAEASLPEPSVGELLEEVKEVVEEKVEEAPEVKEKVEQSKKETDDLFGSLGEFL